MIHEYQVVLFRFPQTSQTKGKLRPALVIRKIPGPHEDWLICMISSRLSQEVEHFSSPLSCNSSSKQKRRIRPSRRHPNRSAELTTKPSPSEGGGKGGGDAFREFYATFRLTAYP